MVRVKKCKYGNGSIEADIYPESSTVPGKVIVSPEGKMVEYTLPEDYKYCKSHVSHARWFIYENFDKILNSEITTEQLIMWY